jgi:hypothetical protein
LPRSTHTVHSGFRLRENETCSGGLCPPQETVAADFASLYPPYGSDHLKMPPLS